MARGGVVSLVPGIAFGDMPSRIFFSEDSVELETHYVIISVKYLFYERF